MGKLIFELSDEDREALEAHRVRLGCRSHAETLRALIRGKHPAALMLPLSDYIGYETPPPPRVMMVRAGEVLKPAKPFTPHPKPGKK